MLAMRSVSREAGASVTTDKDRAFLGLPSSSSFFVFVFSTSCLNRDMTFILSTGVTGKAHIPKRTWGGVWAAGKEAPGPSARATQGR